MSLLTPLRVEDADVFWPWLREHLRWHLRHWADACDLGWTDADVDTRIAAGRLIEREWTELLTASEARDSLVGVLRNGAGRPLGTVYAISRPDIYLGMRVGVLSFLHVDAQARGVGHSQPLVEAAMAWFAVNGLKLAEVHVTAANEAAVRAYAGGGFKVVDHRMLVGISAVGVDPG